MWLARLPYIEKARGGATKGTSSDSESYELLDTDVSVSEKWR